MGERGGGGEGGVEEGGAGDGQSWRRDTQLCVWIGVQCRV